MNYTETPLLIASQGEELLSIVSVPQENRQGRMQDIGVVVLVGGPQYRVGSHRQFTLLARAAASSGFPTIRFDRRGMGDSTGLRLPFEDSNADTTAAIAAFRLACPNVKRIVLWGLCDGASAALLYWQQTQDQAIAGLVLLNPWVQSEITQARTRVYFYYFLRLKQPDFWRKLLTGKLQVRKSLQELSGNIATVAGIKPEKEKLSPWLSGMAKGLRNFPGQILVLLSGKDYTAREFKEWVGLNSELRAFNRKKNLSQVEISEADHTFSSAAWRAEVEQATVGFLRRLAS